MKSAFLYSKQDFPLNLEKINSCVYYNLEKDTFYRMIVMPTCTTFVSQDVEQNQVMTLTKYDPVFLMITMLLAKRKINFDDLPHYLQKRNWSLISTQQKIDGKVEYSLNKEKIFNYLQKKVKILENYFFQKNPLDRLNFVKNEQKSISQDSISLLKNQVNSEFIAQFIKQRFDVNQSRKIAPQIQENEATKPKPLNKNKKSISVSKPEYLPKNQPTLFSSFKKK